MKQINTNIKTNKMYMNKYESQIIEIIQNSKSFLLLWIQFLLVLLSLFCQVYQIYFSLVELDQYIYALYAYYRLKKMN